MFSWRQIASLASIQAVGIAVSMFMLPLFLLRFGTEGFQDIGLYQAAVALFYGLADAGADMWLQRHGPGGLRSYYQIRFIAFISLLNGCALLMFLKVAQGHVLVPALISATCLLVVPVGPMNVAGKLLTPQIVFLCQRLLALSLTMLAAATPLEAIYWQTLSYIIIGLLGGSRLHKLAPSVLSYNKNLLKDLKASIKQLNMRLMPGWVSAGQLLLLRCCFPEIDISMPVLGDKVGRAWHSIIYAIYPSIASQRASTRISRHRYRWLLGMGAVLCVVVGTGYGCGHPFAGIQGALFCGVIAAESRTIICLDQYVLPLWEQLLMFAISMMAGYAVAIWSHQAGWLLGWGLYMLIMQIRVFSLRYMHYEIGRNNA